MGTGTMSLGKVYPLPLQNGLPKGRARSHSRIEEDEDVRLPLPRVHPVMRVALVGAAALVCFTNTLDAEFVFDDTEAVVNNGDVKPHTPLANLFRNDFWGTRLTHNASHKSFRPLTVITFRWNYHLSGGLHPYGFHLANVILHCAASILTLPVFAAVLGHNADHSWSFLCSLLFAVHPIHTEAVAAVVGRADLLSAVFFFMAFLIYVRAMRCDDVARSVGVTVVSVGMVAVAMLCKEQGITAIGVCSAYDLLASNFLRTFPYAHFFHRNPFSKITLPNFRPVLPLLCRQVVLLTSGFGLLFLRWWLMGSTPPSFQRVDNPASFSDSLLLRVLTYQHLYVLNCWLLLCPIWLCFDWSMGCVPLVENVNDPRVVSIAIFWVILVSLVMQMFLMEDVLDRRGVAMGLVFLIVPFLPASNLFFRVGFVIAERVLYLPSAGSCLLVVMGLRRLAAGLKKNALGRNILMLCVCWLVMLLGFRSVVRSAEWQTETTLFVSGLSVCPNNAKVHYNIAKNAADAGNRPLAMSEYREAIRLNPEYNQAMNNLANILKDAGQLNEAENWLRMAIEIRPDFAAAWMNLGIVLSQQKRYDEAEQSYLTALHHRRKSADCFYNLGNLFLEQKRYREAYRAWRNATSLKPTHAVAWNNMVIMLDSIGDTAKAEEVAQEALSHLPEEPGIHFHLANVLGKASRFSEAERHFREAIKLKPTSALYYANLGVLFHRWKKFASAEAAYRKALEIDPSLKSAKDNLILLKKKKNNQ